MWGNMKTVDTIRELAWLRKDIIGRNMPYETCFGNKPLVYADFTASGRAVFSIENYLTMVLQYYANTHTEDDFTGRTMTTLLHEAEHEIKRCVNAGSSGKIIFSGTGATGGISKLQQIIGVYWPPATKKRINDYLEEPLETADERRKKCHTAFLKAIDTKLPIVFVGPYEHHSNEIMWRQTFCEVVEIPLDDEGMIDLDALENELSKPQYAEREKIGSFSAASNVSGVRTRVYDVARILHKHGAIACFDFAACAPYIEIDMNRDDQSYFDAIYLSPHKFIGGPGSSGILIFNERIYKKNLPPTVSAGGTVDFVTMDREKYTEDIETREKPGTPGIMQAIKVALAFQLKEKVGVETIEEIEHFYLKKFYDYYKGNPAIELYGPLDPTLKINIIPFNIKHKDRMYHPKFITTLLNDLFGIQTRAGCSCAGPYGHRLLGITEDVSRYFQCAIGVDRYNGVKPGWVRLNFHYSLSMEEFEYIIKALDFVIEHAEKFLSRYEFDFLSGDWFCKDYTPKMPVELSIDAVQKTPQFSQPADRDGTALFAAALAKAEHLTTQLEAPEQYPTFSDSLEHLMFFYAAHYRNKVGL